MKIVIMHDMAGDEFFANGTEIEVTHHFNGSGDSAFGGARKWPHVRLGVSLCVGEEAYAEELAKRLALTVEEFMAEKGRRYERS